MEPESEPDAQGLQLPAEHGFDAAQGLQGLQGMVAAQGLQPMDPAPQGLQFTAEQGVVWLAQGFIAELCAELLVAAGLV